MANKKPYPTGFAEDAVRVLEAHGYDAMNEFIAAFDEGREPPSDYSALVKPAFVYLAFFGSNDISPYLKVGITHDLGKRMAQYRTACPLPRNLLLAAMMPSRGEAADLETAILDAMGGDRLHGEWVRVLSQTEIVARIERIAEKACGRQIQFVEW